jgi:hypothetical protein
MMLFGILWVMAAPLLLVPVVLGLAYLLRGFGKAKALAAALLLAIGPVVAIYALDRNEFAGLCREIGRPTITSRAVADGIYLNSDTANSFGNRYVLEEGFAWLERQDIYDRSGFVRVARKSDGSLSEDKIPGLTARYEVRETFETGRRETGVSRTLVIDRQTGEEMARAADAHFSGGRLWWLLGGYGSTSCMSPLTDSQGFDDYYHLARKTLRP